MVHDVFDAVFDTVFDAKSRPSSAILQRNDEGGTVYVRTESSLSLIDGIIFRLQEQHERFSTRSRLEPTKTGGFQRRVDFQPHLVASSLFAQPWPVTHFSMLVDGPANPWTVIGLLDAFAWD
jgi:hypothetical protein